MRGDGSVYDLEANRITVECASCGVTVDEAQSASKHCRRCTGAKGPARRHPALAVSCPTCRALPGRRCRILHTQRPRDEPHAKRIEKMRIRLSAGERHE
jgi:hypothetical protein